MWDGGPGERVGGTASLKLGTHCLTRFLYNSFFFFFFFLGGGGGGLGVPHLLSAVPFISGVE